MATQAGLIDLHTALSASSCLFLHGLDNYNMIDTPDGRVTPAMLPLQDLSDTSPNSSRFFDIIDEYDGAVGHDRPERRYSARTL
jgi:hypothetical protein